MKTSPTSIALLAAGASIRFGRPKQLIQFQGRSLLRHLAEVCASSNAGDVHVVLGAYAELLKHQLHGLRLRTILNLDWNSGISSSLRMAVKNLDRATKALLVVLCDQPLVTSALLNRMLETREKSGKPIVACEYGNSLGVPALFDRKFFAEIESLKGDLGAKQIILKHRREVACVPFPEGSIDIDTPRDLPGTTHSFQEDI